MRTCQSLPKTSAPFGSGIPWYPVVSLSRPDRILQASERQVWPSRLAGPNPTDAHYRKKSCYFFGCSKHSKLCWMLQVPKYLTLQREKDGGVSTVICRAFSLLCALLKNCSGTGFVRFLLMQPIANLNVIVLKIYGFGDTPG